MQALLALLHSRQTTWSAVAQRRSELPILSLKFHSLSIRLPARTPFSVISSRRNFRRKNALAKGALQKIEFSGLCEHCWPRVVLARTR